VNHEEDGVAQADRTRMLRRGIYQAGILVVNGCGKVNGEAAP
jgi:hypothetical protein